MRLAFPRAGEIIRYAYLWHGEQAMGKEEGSKDRPCLVLAVNPDLRLVWVLPITHAWPGASSAAEKIPAATKKRLGLDDEESWIIIDEVNEFLWPGPDIRPVPGKFPLTGSHGLLPAALHERIKARFKSLSVDVKVKKIKRTQ